jgi:hypothetical protein
MARQTTSEPRRSHKNPRALVRRVGKGIPAREFNLTPAERALLSDQDWVSEDDADAIIAYRRRKEPAISLDDYLRQRGHDLAG